MKQISTLFIVLGLTARMAWADVSDYHSWGISPTAQNASIHLQGALAHFKKSHDVVVAVIDTGIDPTHPLLKDALVVKEGNVSSTNYGRDFSKGRQSNTAPFDRHGHGTHIAGIIKTIFKDVKILALKYYNPAATGEDNLASTIQALRYAIEQNVDMINYSGGGPEASAEERALLETAQKKGILVVAASGNEGSNIDIKENAYFPASYGLDNLITVTAYDQKLQILPTSNVGKRHVDIAAPGDRIKSSLPHGRSGFLTGTSQATAFVTGVAALLKSQHPHLRPEEIKRLIRQSATKVKSMGSASVTGGVLNAQQALGLAMRSKTPSMTVKRDVAEAPARQGAGRITYRVKNTRPVSR